MNHYFLHDIIADKEACINWCRRKHLLPSAMNCPSCGFRMLYDVNRGAAVRFRCRRKAAHRPAKDIDVAAANNTWFSGTHLPIGKVLLITYCWSQKDSYDRALHECRLDQNEICSRETVADWYSYCRETAAASILDLHQRVGRIGGPGHVVEIDETKIGKRKFNRGRLVEGK